MTYLASPYSHPNPFLRGQRPCAACRTFITGVLPETKTLIQELQMFKAKVTTAGKNDLKNWRVREHDDLVLAQAIPLWYAERHPPGLWPAEPVVLISARDLFA